MAVGYAEVEETVRVVLEGVVEVRVELVVEDALSLMSWWLGVLDSALGVSLSGAPSNTGPVVT